MMRDLQPFDWVFIGFLAFIGVVFVCQIAFYVWAWRHDVALPPTDLSNPADPLSPLNPANPASPLFPH